MKIKNISILTEEQLEKYKDIIPFTDSHYWIKPNREKSDIPETYATIANNLNEIDAYIYHVSDYNGIRPTLIVSGLPRSTDDKVYLFGYVWTILETKNNDDLLLCDTIIDYSSYTLIESYLKDWLKSMSIRYKDKINKPTYEELEAKLKKIEEKLEKGTLLELPCQIGDRVWFYYLDDIWKGTVKNINYDAEKKRFIISGLATDNIPFWVTEVFLTRQAVIDSIKEK